MELLVLKASDGSNVVYLKKEAEGFIFCAMNKASVYPLSAIEDVRRYRKEAEGSGIENVEIFKLHITEIKIED